MDQDIEFLPSGDTGLTVQFGRIIDRRLSRRVVRLRALVDKARIAGVIETVPTYRSLLIHYNPLRVTQADLVDAIGRMLDSPGEAEDAAGTAWRLPVCFDGPEFASDLTDVAAQTGTTEAGIVDAMTAGPFHVYMLGFAPGQPYMGDLPKRLSIPRRENPTPKIPAGSVIIATGMVGIYPKANPTGWHVVGRTPATLFDPAAERPALFAAGDTVSFHGVGAAEYRDFEARLATGDRALLRDDRRDGTA